MSQSSLLNVEPVKIVDYILPVLLPKLPSARGQAGGSATVTGDGSGMAVHDIAGAYHTGTLADEQGPQFLKLDGTRLLVGNLSVYPGVTIDGVDLSAHASDPAAHHALVTVEGPLTITGQQVGLNYGDGLENILAVQLAVKLDGDGGMTFGTVTRGLRLGTPSTVGVGTINSVGMGTHSHQVDYTTAGAANKLLALDGLSRAYAAIHEASNYVHTPEITALSDLSINPPDDLFLSPGGDLDVIAGSNIVRIGPGNQIKTSNYASQTTGWSITYDGEGDFRYLYADEMHVKVFIADLEQALAGGQIISKSVAQLSQPFTAPAPGGSAYLWVRDLPSARGMQVFQNGDTIRLRKFTRSGGSLNVSDCWGTVTFVTGSYSTSPDASGSYFQGWVFTRSAGSNAGAMSTGTVIDPGSLALDYGTTGNGFYEVNAIDGLYAANSPYLQFVRWTGHPATGKAVRVRLGQLRGMFGQDEFGLFVGSGTTDTDTYLRLSDYAAGNGMNNLPMTIRSGGNKAVVISPTSGISLYSAGSFGSVSNRITFYNTTSGYINGYIAASHDTDWLRIYASRGQLDLRSFLASGANGGNEARITLDGQGYGSTNIYTGVFYLTATDTFSSKVLRIDGYNATINGYEIWTTQTLTSPMQVGGNYSYVLLNYLQTSAIRTGGSLSVLNAAGSAYTNVSGLNFQVNGGKFLSNAKIQVRNLSDNGDQSLQAANYTNIGGQFYSDANYAFLNLAGTAYKRITAGQLYLSLPASEANAGQFSNTANGAGYGYFDYFYAGSRSGYLIWSAANIGMQADGKNAFVSGSRVGINTSAPAYAIDMIGEGRITGALRTDTAFSMAPRAAPAASATYGVLYVNTSGQLRYIRPGGGDYYVAG